MSRLRWRALDRSQGHDKLSCRDGSDKLTCVLWSTLILDSARKHGLADEDMLHAYRNAIRIYDLSEDMTTLVGPNRSGHHLIEVSVADSEEGPVIVHTMTARPKFLR